MKHLLTALLAVLALALFAAAVPAGDGAATLDVLTEGKAAFEKKCSFCHSLARTLSQNKERGQWSMTVKRMVSYGAPLNSGQRQAVTSYLTAKSNFETNCNACHSSLRVLSGDAFKQEWKATVGRMAKHLEELAAKDKEARLLTAEEVDEIAAYLSLNIPKD
jgi:mono/diheme cytochrome c family protein